MSNNDSNYLLSKIANLYDNSYTSELTDMEIQIGEMLVYNGYLKWINNDDEPRFGLGDKVDREVI